VHKILSRFRGNELRTMNYELTAFFEKLICRCAG
jgi:hypothetical protein